MGTSEPSREPDIERPWARSAREVLDELDASLDGLDGEQVERRRETHGANRLRRTRAPGALAIFLRQFRSLVVALLAAAAAVAFLFEDWVEGGAILVVLAINALIGFVAELRAERSMEALRALGSVSSRVRRGGSETLVPAEELVPGDIVLIDEGDVVTADLRLVEASRLEADESALTGESAPVGKGVEPVDGDAVLAERASMLFKGTAATRGSAAGVVVATGMATELGRVARLVEEADDQVTPLEERLEALGRRLVWLTLVVAAGTTALGLAAGRGLKLMVETGIALAVAAVPEGLPIVATLALARGMWRMARRHALINRLAAVETLGATTLIFTDKTGTLTENRMSVRRLELPAASYRFEGDPSSAEGAVSRDDPSGSRPAVSDGEPLLREALTVAALCNNAAVERTDDGGLETAGDPMEVALLLAAARLGLRRPELLRRHAEIGEEAFERSTQMMATAHDGPDGRWTAVKGAAEAVLDACTAVRTAAGVRRLDDARREDWLERNRSLAEDGLRVLALARRDGDLDGGATYRDLTFLGLVGLSDPPRRDVGAALEACADAGVRVVMVTGDQAPTALAVARAVGLAPETGDVRVVDGRQLAGLDLEDDEVRRRLRQVPLFARVDPEQKLDLIALHQGAGEVVAMTGDGVNDAPALKKADIGIAMGRRGTQVAREAADMVLTDDAFSTIVSAIEQGRVIFGNIRRFVVYLLSCNVSEILVVAGAMALGAPLPILPLQILFLNLVTDVFPALALAFGEGERDVLRRPPRDPAEPILDRGGWWRIGGFGGLITLVVLASLLAATRLLELPVERAVTLSFLTLALAQLWNVFNVRDAGSGLLGNDIVRNPWVWGALGLCLALLVAAVYVPGLAAVLRLEAPGARGWALAGGLSLVPWAIGQAALALPRRRTEGG